MLRVCALVLALAVFGRGHTLADEARIPIFQSTTITQAGYFILTRDIAIAGGNGITIQASNVILDLNGRKISGSTASGNLIEIADGASDVVVRGGYLLGGLNAIHAQSTAGTRMTIERVEIADPVNDGIEIAGALQVDVLSCKMRSSMSSPSTLFAVIIQPMPGGSFTGRYVDNVIEGWGAGLALIGIDGGQVRRNVLRNATKVGVSVTGAGNLVEGNECAASNDGIAMNGSGNQVIRNLVTGTLSHAILISSSDTRVAENIISGCSGYAIFAQGPRMLLEDNLVQGTAGSPGCGIYFPLDSSSAYRDNMLRGNAGGGVCGPANTDAGGNIL